MNETFPNVIHCIVLLRCFMCGMSTHPLRKCMTLNDFAPVVIWGPFHQLC